MHKDCRDLIPLADVLGIMKSSARVSHVERGKKISPMILKK
jgi:hypothetical protein